MKFCQANYEDISKYYSGTFVKFEGMEGEFEGKPLLAGEQIHYIKKVTPVSAIGTRLMEDGTEVEFEFHFSETAEDAPDVEMIFPKKCFFNVDDVGALLLARNPVRKWKKGITNENTLIQKLGSTVLTSVSMDMGSLNWYIKKPAYMSFTKRMKSYAVSRRFAVATSGMLFCDTKQVGRVDYKKQTVFVVHSMFIPEITRILKDHSQYNTWKIEVEAKAPTTVISDDFSTNDDGELIINEE